MNDTYQEGQHKIFAMLYGNPTPSRQDFESVLRERKLTREEKNVLYARLYAGPAKR